MRKRTDRRQKSLKMMEQMFAFPAALWYNTARNPAEVDTYAGALKDAAENLRVHCRLYPGAGLPPLGAGDRGGRVPIINIQNISKKSAMMTIHHSGFRNKRKRPFLLYL